MSWHLSPRYLTLVSGQLSIAQLSIDYNMDVYYQIKHRLKAPTLARKFDILH